ncbi:recombinase family protein [Streptomyces sp. NPDC002133]|uniref:recombinase family protein n=1 Tax=Streptomyces sp. NPDC002133 TaxID=3154409 RepID=UPI00332C34B6
MTPGHAPRRVIGYARISKATDESTSIERQRELITATCKARGWALAEIVEDVDVSATKTRLDRPGLARVRDTVAAGRADTIMVWRIDRVARSVSDLSNLVDEWTKAGAALVSATEPFDTTTAAGTALLQMLGVFAEFEAATIRDRVLAARAALVRARRWPGGSPPYGYRVVENPDGPGKVLEVEPVEAAYVRKAADMILAGKSLYATTTAINAAGSVPRKAKGGAWSMTSLRIVLTQDASLGYMTHHGKVLRDDDGAPAQAWEPVMPEEDMARLRVLLKPSTRPGGERKRRARLLSGGLLRCSTCGGSLRVNQTGGKNPTTRYSCRGASDGTGCARGVSIVAERIEEHIESTFLGMVGRFDVVEVRETVREVADLAAVEAAIKAATAELADVDDDEREAELLADLRTMKARRKQLADMPTEPLVEYVPTGETFAEAWAARDTDGRRALLENAIHHVVIRPGVRGRRGVDASRVDIHWRDGDAPTAG